MGLCFLHQALGLGGGLRGEQGPAGVGHQPLQKVQQVAVIVHQQYGGMRGDHGLSGALLGYQVEFAVLTQFRADHAPTD